MRLSLPAGCVTGVGSLPFIDPQEAVAFVADYSPVLPFWPQLPRRHPGEGMIAQGLGTLGPLVEPAFKPHCWQVRAGEDRAFATGLERVEACLIPATAAGFIAFEAAFRAGRFPVAVATKAQAAGPVTLAHCVYVGGEPLACHSDGLNRVASFVARQAVWQVQRLQRFGKPVIFVLDEPALSLALSGASPVHESEFVAAVALVLHAIREAGAVAGLHCCAPLPVGLLSALDFDLLSFDAHLAVDGDGWGDMARAILARSGFLAFGLVPTGPTLDVGPNDLFSQWRRLAATAGDVMTIANKTIVTATCGLGLAKPGDAAAVFERCRQVGQRIRELNSA